MIRRQIEDDNKNRKSSLVLLYSYRLDNIKYGGNNFVNGVLAC